MYDIAVLYMILYLSLHFLALVCFWKNYFFIDVRQDIPVDDFNGYIRSR